MLALLASITLTLSAHDLFLKPADFFVAPGATVTIHVLNGSFTGSDAGTFTMTHTNRPLK